MVNGTYAKGRVCANASLGAGDKPTVMGVTTGSGVFHGVFHSRPYSTEKWALDGFWSDPGIKYKPGVPRVCAFVEWYLFHR